VAINRIECPECGAGLKSPSGFKPGQSVACPKCETYFTVEEPAEPDEDEEEVKPKKKAKAAVVDDDDEDEAPKKKKKKKRRDDDDDDEDGGSSYKNSPLRFVILGILVVVMIVLGIMLILKMKREREDAEAPPREERPVVNTPPPNNVQVPPGGFPVGQFPPPGGPNGNVFPKGGNFPNGMNPPPKNGGGLDPFAGILGGSPAAGSAEGKQLTDSLSKKLIGTWEGTGGDGTKHTVTYQPGTYKHETVGKGKGSLSEGTYQVSGLIGTKGLKLRRGGDPAVKVVFEGDELLHDTDTPGETVVLRKKA
jgi:uncharacterized Zn finger protein (UPF0148 family)